MAIKSFLQDKATGITDRVVTGKRRYYHTDKIKGAIDKPFTTLGLIFHLDPKNSASWPGSGTTLFDLTDNDNDFTMNGDPTFSNTAAEGLGSFAYDGAGDLFYLEHNSTVEFEYGQGDQKYSFEIWFKMPSTTSNRRLFSKLYASNSSSAGSTNNSQMYQWVAKSTTYQRLRQYMIKRYGSTTYESGTISTDDVLYDLDTWQHFVYTWDFDTNASNGQKIYKNGSEVYEKTINGFNDYDNNYAKGGPLGAWAIGGGWLQYNDSITGTNFIGSIGIVRYYNVVLSATEVATNYDAEKLRYGHDD